MSESFVLKIDLDIHPPEEWMAAWERKNEMILGLYGLKPTKVNKKESPRGWHYWYLLHKYLTPEETNKLQFLLGDDHTRVKINMWKIARSVPHWNKLFDRKLWRKDQETITCWFCGNKIPLVVVHGEKEPEEDDRSG